MNNTKIHHIGYLVKKIEAAQKKFEQLGYQVSSPIVYDDIRKVHICFLEKDGYTVELVSPASNESVVYSLLQKYKNCPYHICYETRQFEETLNHFVANGFTAIDAPTPAPALQNARVCFLMSPVIGMIELLESK